MSHSSVAETAFLLSERGPVIARSLEPEIDRVWTVDRNGRFVLANLRNVTLRKEISVWRLFSAAGDVVLAEGMLVMTSDGPLKGSDVEDRLLGTRAVRLDVVTAKDLPPPVTRKVARSDIYRACFGALPSGIAQLPRTNGVADTVGPRLENLLQSSGLRFRRIEDDRWLTFMVDPVTATGDGNRDDFDAQVEALEHATAWSIHASGIESRVRTDDHLLRSRLLAALVGAGRSFEVKWTPGYHPVEARVRSLPDRSWPARLPVNAIAAEAADAVEVETEDRGHLIVNLAVLTA